MFKALLVSLCRPETDFESSIGQVRRGPHFWTGQVRKTGARMDLSVLIPFLVLLLLLL